jgi:neutral amino acid transport system ATP-binding protein
VPAQVAAPQGHGAHLPADQGAGAHDRAWRTCSWRRHGQGGERFFTALVPPLWRAKEAEITDRADELLVRFKLDHMRDEFAGTLSGGQRKLLEMARALMVEPTLVMLDEPMAGVNPALTQSLLGHVKGLRDDEGRTVVFVEHDMDVVFDISDWVVCLAQGEVIAEGRPSEIGSNPAVIDAYLGATHNQDPARRKKRHERRAS